MYKLQRKNLAFDQQPLVDATSKPMLRSLLHKMLRLKSENTGGSVSAAQMEYAEGGRK